MTDYRVDRREALTSVGLLVILSAVPAFLAIVWTPWFWVAVVALLGLAARAFLAPPVVLRVREDGFRGTDATQGRRVDVRWTSVERVSTDAGRLSFLRDDQSTVTIDIAPVGRLRRQLVRDVYDRLNAAHGYQRFRF